MWQQAQRTEREKGGSQCASRRFRRLRSVIQGISRKDSGSIRHCKRINAEGMLL